MVLENLAVQGNGHTVFDLVAEARVAAVQFLDQAAEIGDEGSYPVNRFALGSWPCRRVIAFSGA